MRIHRRHALCVNFYEVSRHEKDANRESHNAMRFALAATRFGVTELFGKLLSRTCRAFEQLGQRHLAVKLAESISEDATCKQISKEFSRVPAESFKTRVYTYGGAEVLFRIPDMYLLNALQCMLGLNLDSMFCIST